MLIKFMKKIQLAFSIILFLSTLTIVSQWIICSGSSDLTNIQSIPVIQTLDLNTVVIAGGTVGNPQIYITTNGGLNFQSILGDLTGPELHYLYALNKDTMFVGDAGGNGGGSGNAKVWKTTNKGTNWNFVLSTGTSQGFIYDINFDLLSTKYGIIVCSNPVGAGVRIYKTNNYGANSIIQTIISSSFQNLALHSFLIV